MKAALFFKVLQKGRAIYGREHAIKMVDICDAMSITLHHKNYQLWRNNFLDRAFGGTRKKALSLKNERTAHILASAFRAATPGSPHVPKAVTRGR